MKKNAFVACFLALLLLLPGCARGPQSAAPSPRNSTDTPIPRSSTDTPEIAVDGSTPSLSLTLVPSPTPTAPLLPVIFDDDGSPDGSAALFYLLGHPGVSIQFITISFGEAHPLVYVQHIGRKLDELGIHDIPLGAGRDAPLAGGNEFPEGLRQGADNFWGLPIPNAGKVYLFHDAPAYIVWLLNQVAAPVTIFISGPCTSLAQALQLDPGIRKNIAAVFIMGGAVYAPGNITDLVSDSGNTVAEWNIYADPLAASIVFDSGLDIYLVPLDATNQVTIGRQDTSQWRLGGGTADFAADIYDMLLDGWGADGAAVWDLMTAAIMVKPGLCVFQPLHLKVITDQGVASGQTVIVPDEEPNIHVCLEPDVLLIKQTLIDIFSNSP